MDDIYDEDEDLSSKIKHFLSKDSSFRDPSFDPSPYLLKVLKDKQANQQLLVEKQTSLVQLENQAQQLIEQIAIDQSQCFMKLLQVPRQFGQQLQKLKHSIANVKRKVKETKSLLIMTQKDIQQIHLNCVFNKLIYRKIKEVELKLNQYQTASLALKNHLYLDCAQNIPVFEGNSVLENALTTRAENLKLRFLSQAIQQIRLFLYFTPRLSLPSGHRFIDDSDLKEQIFNEAVHQTFYKRYLLFKRARCHEYLSSIWQLNVLDQKSGRVGVMQDIINGIIRIGKANQITDSLSLDSKKSINNIFLVLTYFFYRQCQEDDNNTSKQVKWFTSTSQVNHVTFFSAVFCISAALLRKMIIIRRICYQYLLTEVVNNLSSSNILGILSAQIFSLVKNIYFPQIVGAVGYESTQHDLINKIAKISDYRLWPYLKNIIEGCFHILVTQLRQVEKQVFQMPFPQLSAFLKPFEVFQRKFWDLFHQQFIKTMEQIFPQGRGFNLQSLDTVASARYYSVSDLQFCCKYVSEDKKTVKQFLNVISLLNSLWHYFQSNQFEPIKYKQYVTFLMVFFYFKLNSTVYRFMISPVQFDKLMEARMKDGKVKNKEKHFEQRYVTIIATRIDYNLRTQRKHFKHQEGERPQLRNIQQLKMLRVQIQMLLFYASNHFKYLQQVTKNAEVDKFERQLEKHEPSNYDENVNSKLIRVWEQLIKPLQLMNNSLSLLKAALFRKIIDLYFNISAHVYLQTGIY